MNKKEYMKPMMKSVALRHHHIICASQPRDKYGMNQELQQTDDSNPGYAVTYGF